MDFTALKIGDRFSRNGRTWVKTAPAGATAEDTREFYVYSSQFPHEVEPLPPLTAEEVAAQVRKPVDYSIAALRGIRKPGHKPPPTAPGNAGNPS